MINKTEIPVRLSGAEVKKTRLGWKAKCKRCGTWIKFGKHEIESTGQPFEKSPYNLVASGYIYAKENNNLAKDFEERKLDWVDFARRKRKLEYRMAQTPFTAFTMASAIRLVCPQCANTTAVNVDFGDEVELKKLPMEVEALVTLGIKKDNIQYFQLRTGKLARDFVKLMKHTSKEIRLLEETKVKVTNLLNSLPSPTDTIAEVFSDVKATAKASTEAQILNLKKWMKTTVSQMEDKLFPDVQGGGIKELTQPDRTTTNLHTIGAKSPERLRR